MLGLGDPWEKHTCFGESCWAMRTSVNHCAYVGRRNAVGSVGLRDARVAVYRSGACAEPLSFAAFGHGKESYDLSLFGFGLERQQEVQLGSSPRKSCPCSGLVRHRPR